jgi:hypothetical protein
VGIVILLGDCLAFIDCHRSKSWPRTGFARLL